MFISKLWAWNKSLGLLALARSLIELHKTAFDGASKSSNKDEESY